MTLSCFSHLGQNMVVLNPTALKLSFTIQYKTTKPGSPGPFAHVRTMSLRGLAWVLQMAASEGCWRMCYVKWGQVGEKGKQPRLLSGQRGSSSPSVITPEHSAFHTTYFLNSRESAVFPLDLEVRNFKPAVCFIPNTWVKIFRDLPLRRREGCPGFCCDSGREESHQIWKMETR